MKFKEYYSQKLSRQFLIPVITFLVLVFVILIVVSAEYAKSKVYQSETESALERTKEVKETIIQLIEQTQILAGIASEDIHVQNG
ncbi:MAG TPA: hypothetical protein PKJ08_10755, partial [Candidatus Cloacimonadota bacterium]|nr:hypothetical protein [Candidatus Cloacimonadota bacterium]